MSLRRKEGSLGIAILIALVLLSLFLGFLPAEARNDDPGTVNSAKPLGRRALYLLLRESDRDARAFADAPRDLPRGRSVLWLPRAPTAKMPVRRAGVVPGGTPERVGLHRLEYYKAFVESGGTIILAAGDDTTRFLSDSLGLIEAEGIEVDHEFEHGVVRVRTSGGEVIELSSSVSGALRGLDPNGEARALWTIEGEESTSPFAVEIPSGLGSVVLLASDEFVENRYIGDLQHALAAVRLVEELAQGGPVLFSEYEAGHWDPKSTLSLLFGPSLLLTTLHALVLLALFLWLQGFARAFARDPEPLALFSPYLRARSLADVFTRGRRTRTLGALLRSGALERYRRIARLRAPRPAGAEGAGSALPPVVEQDVTEFARAAGVRDLESRLSELLVRRHADNDTDLDALGRKLLEMERELETRMRTRPGAGVRSGES